MVPPFGDDHHEDFCDYPLDDDGDGWIDIVTASIWSKQLHWRKKPGPGGGEWQTFNSSEISFAETVLQY